MKECKYCRTRYDDNLTVCPNCGGTKVVTAEELAEETAIKQREVEYREKANAATEVHNKRLFGILAAVVVVVIVVIAVISINANKPLSNGMTKDEGEEVLATGIAYLDNGDYEAAIDCFLQLPSDSKQYEEAQSLLLQSKDSYRHDILDRVNSHVEKGEYDSAFTLISKAQEFLPDDSELRVSYDNVYVAYVSSVLDRVNFYVSAGQYEVALEYLNGIQVKYPNDAALQDSYSSTLSAYQAVVRTEAIEQADAYVADDNYPDAISTINTALKKIEQDMELSAKLTVYQNDYRSRIIAKADSVLREQGYQEAISVVNNGLVVLPNDSEFLGKIEEYRTYAPVFLYPADAYATNSYLRTDISNTDWLTDNYGKTYSADRVICNCDSGMFSDVGSIQYYLASKYSTLTGTIYVPDISKNINTNSILVKLPYVQIYGDGVMLYELSSLTNTDKPVDFSVDISNVEFLTVSIYGSWYRGDGTGLIPMNCVADLAVSK